MLALNRTRRGFLRAAFTPGGGIAREYIAKRQIGRKMATAFGLASRRTVERASDAIAPRGYTDYEMFDAGLVRQGKNGGFTTRSGGG